MERITPEMLLAMPDWKDRVRMLTAQAMRENLLLKIGTDHKPRTISEAIYRVRTRTGQTTGAYARRVSASRTAILRLETGAGRGTPTLLERIAADAESLGLYSVADYLKFQAVLLTADINKKGGRR